MDVVADHNELYGTKEYWYGSIGSIETVTNTHERALQERQVQKAADVSFDWFKSYSDISHLLAAEITDKSATILMLGCGNSTLSEELYGIFFSMWEDGYRNIVSIDYSGVVIENMRQRNEHRQPGLEWLEMDMRDLKFDDGSFDVVIDKGTMDSMMTAKGDVWDPPDEVVQNCTKEVDEVLRVLKPQTGCFIYLTFGQPHFRKRYLTREGYTLQVKELGEAFHYYCYILRSDSKTSD